MGAAFFVSPKGEYTFWAHWGHAPSYVLLNASDNIA